ncbi:MAG: HlyD family efflux transporter periplasmic adaptor subunit [Bryobacteraceae bacterium]|nr:HlyD family efflux transporter periplasmic adaptor subunit [Bryobacteraceae bacterium]MDW8379230.1 HlyD family efflux transporter periplasmic adaptor subunit [Bryobacterales bacterium]
MKKILAAVILLAILAAAYLYSGWFKKESVPFLRVSGNLELTQVDLAFKIPGKLVELPVREGERLARGALVARLDATATLQAKAQQQAMLEAARAQLEQILTAVRLQREQLDNELALRRAELRAAEAQLQDLLSGARPQEIAQARAALEEAKAWRQQASEDWERAQKLFLNEDISRAQYDQFRARLQSTQQLVAQAEQRLALVEEGPRKPQIEVARSQLERARAAIRLTEANRLELQRKEQEIAVRRAEMERAKAGVAIVDAQLEDTRILCPMDGIVLVKAAEVGEVLAAGAVVVTVGDLDRPWLRAFIGERELGRVKLGAKVKLTTDSYPGKIYWGRVSFISSEAEFTPKQIQTPDERVKLVYRIKVDVENPNQELKANMPVDAEIQL